MKIKTWLERLDETISNLQIEFKQIEDGHKVFNEVSKLSLNKISKLIHDIQIARSYGPGGCRYKR